MKSILPLALSAILTALVGCAKDRKDAEKTKQESASKAHAEAAKKEMQTLPEVFATPDYYKKNEPTNRIPAEAKTESVKK